MASEKRSLSRVALCDAIAYQIGMNLRVRDLRLAKGWSQAQLADAAGLRTATISKIETTPEAVKLETLVKCAKGLNVALVDLFNGATGDPTLRKMIGNFLKLTMDQRDSFIRQIEAVAPNERQPG